MNRLLEHRRALPGMFSMPVAAIALAACSGNGNPQDPAAKESELPSASMMRRVLSDPVGIVTEQTEADECYAAFYGYKLFEPDEALKGKYDAAAEKARKLYADIENALPIENRDPDSVVDDAKLFVGIEQTLADTDEAHAKKLAEYQAESEACAKKFN